MPVGMEGVALNNVIGGVNQAVSKMHPDTVEGNK